MKLDLRRLASQEAVDEIHYGVSPICYATAFDSQGLCPCTFWKTQDGIVWPVWVMTNSHVTNSVRYLERQIQVIESSMQENPDEPYWAYDMKVITRLELMTRSVGRLKEEMFDRSDDRSWWNIIGDVTDWSPNSIESLLSNMQDVPFDSREGHI